MGLIHVLYIFFYSFKHGPSSCNIWKKLRKCGLKGISQFLLDFLRKPSSCVLPSVHGTLVAPLAHGEGLVPEISTSKELSCSG